MEADVVILIGEDDRGHFILIKHALRNAKIFNELVWLCDGQEALDFIYTPDGEIKLPEDKRYMLLLDIRMPKIDGVEVLEEIKDDVRLKDLPVIMVTSSDNPDNVRLCTRLGCDGYIVKPLDEEAIALIRRLGAAIPRKEHSR
ncbi:MAG: response regulator [Phycisphaerae bacterium]|nr:response regulator [Phycisphaerae bacterium]